MLAGFEQSEPQTSLFWEEAQRSVLKDAFLVRSSPLLPSQPPPPCPLLPPARLSPLGQLLSPEQLCLLREHVSSPCTEEYIVPLFHTTSFFNLCPHGHATVGNTVHLPARSAPPGLGAKTDCLHISAPRSNRSELGEAGTHMDYNFFHLQKQDSLSGPESPSGPHAAPDPRSPG